MRVSLETSLGDSFTSQHLRLLHCLYHVINFTTKLCKFKNTKPLHVDAIWQVSDLHIGQALTACWRVAWKQGRQMTWRHGITTGDTSTHRQMGHITFGSGQEQEQEQNRSGSRNRTGVGAGTEQER